MGELRASHFHAGIDIKTGGQSGLPVYASADGYISRIKISTGGYGNALYIDHPNGTTTVYAHLERYEILIDKYVLENQYEQQTFEIDLFPGKNEIPVKRGELIGFSGNSGSSTGPHLHFEIRDSQQHVLDPLMFSFQEIRDHISPIFKSIAFVSLNEQARINGLFGRYTFDLQKKDGIYQLSLPVSLNGKIGIELYCYDMMDGVYSKNGIMETVLTINGDTVFGEKKSRLSFEKQRNILVHTDYQATKNGAPRFNKLFVDAGNNAEFYTTPSSGFVFNDSVHTLSIRLKDSYGNTSVFETVINQRPTVPARYEFENGDVFRNYLPLRALVTEIPTLYFKDAPMEIPAYSTQGVRNFYIWDLRKGLPDSIKIDQKTIKTNFIAKIPSGSESHIHLETMDLSVYSFSLFDTLYLKYTHEEHPKFGWELFKFDHTDIPLRSSVEVNVRPLKPHNIEKTHIYKVIGDRLSYVGGKWNSSGISFRSSELVTFTIAKDSVPPFVQPVIVNTDKLYFKITDDLSGVKTYKATLNGSFLLMEYETKKNLIWAKPKNPNIPLTGEFILRVEDNAGNLSTYQKTL